MTHDFSLITACRLRQVDLSRARTRLNGLLCASISIDAEPPKKLQVSSVFFCPLRKSSRGSSGQPVLTTQAKVDNLVFVLQDTRGVKGLHTMQYQI